MMLSIHAHAAAAAAAVVLCCARCQVMDPADADKFYFDPLDCTKVRHTA